jgi:Magnesium chelatase, subunit ChlI
MVGQHSLSPLPNSSISNESERRPYREAGETMDKALLHAGGGRQNRERIGWPPLLPAMAMAQVPETTRIHRVTSRTGDRTGLGTARPFRAPDHTVADAGLIGGQMPPLGEVSLARHGMLFLQKPPEFRRHVIGALRHQLGEGEGQVRHLARTDLGSVDPHNPEVAPLVDIGHAYARSNSKTSEPSTATISSATTSLTAAPSPSLRDMPFSVTPPLATCTQA